MKRKYKLMTLGANIKYFKLYNPLSNNMVSLKDIKSNHGTVIMFICNHCPYVKHINKKLIIISNYYINKGISFIAINSNDIKKYPEDSPENMIKCTINLKYNFPYLFDETQKVAKEYNVLCTPDFFIFNNHDKLVYHGQFDNSRPNNNIQPTGKDISNALDNLLLNKKIDQIQNPSIGCSIKWIDN